MLVAKQEAEQRERIAKEAEIVKEARGKSKEVQKQELVKEAKVLIEEIKKGNINAEQLSQIMLGELELSNEIEQDQVVQAPITPPVALPVFQQ